MNVLLYLLLFHHPSLGQFSLGGGELKCVVMPMIPRLNLEYMIEGLGEGVGEGVGEEREYRGVQGIGEGVRI